MTSTRSLITAWNLRPQKRFGQNFLNDPVLAERIAQRAVIGTDAVVVEVGPGLGALTLPLAARAVVVYAVENDARLMAPLQAEIDAAGLGNVTVVQGDFLRFDLQAVRDRHCRRLTVAGNLPYNISSQVVVRLIEQRPLVERAVLMFQQEMAERLAAPPGGRSRGRLSVMLQYCADVRAVFRISAGRFFPRPAVDSQVLEIVFHDPPQKTEIPDRVFFRVVGAAFAQRRKTLKNALAAGGLDLGPADAQGLLEACGIDPARRAETLSVAEFARLARGLDRGPA